MENLQTTRNAVQLRSELRTNADNTQTIVWDHTHAFARGIVFVNNENAKVFSVATKCRKSDKEALIRAVARCVLSEMRAAYIQNNDEDAQNSGNTVALQMRQVLNSHTMYLTDKDGHYLPNACLTTRDQIKLNGKKKKLSEVFTFKKTLTGTTLKSLYELVVIDALSWEHPSVVAALNWWVNSTLKQLHWLTEAQAAIGVGAMANDAEAPEETQAETPELKEAV